MLRNLSQVVRNVRFAAPGRVAVRFMAIPNPREGFLSGANASYLESVFEQWKLNPTSVHKSFQAYFEHDDFVPPPGLCSVAPPSTTAGNGSMNTDKNSGSLISILNLIRGYQIRGHKLATLDPLGINAADLDHCIPPELTLAHHGLSEADLDKDFFLPPMILNGNVAGRKTLREVLAQLKKIYCGNIGIEYMFIEGRDKCDWIRSRVEKPFTPYSVEEKRNFFDGLIKSNGFEQFLAKKFVATKRFGVEGCEVLIPACQRLAKKCCEAGVESMVWGMPHRGRLNVLNNVFQKPIEMIFCEFQSISTDEDEGNGDVMYHKGTETVLTFNDKKLKMQLIANPSHLEAVNPVVLGRSRAEQLYLKDDSRTKVVPVLMHGDAAFSGQGVVYEGFGMSDLKDYTTGGTVHIVVNNQIGFTTDPRYSRSSDYCTDVAKVVGSPIFHVNADDAEAVMRCVDLAVEYRQTFHKDVVIDLVGYRRMGHNETDMPKFTQPRMYNQIEKHPLALDITNAKFVQDGVIDSNYTTNFQSQYDIALGAAFDKAKTYTRKKSDFEDENWLLFKNHSAPYSNETGVELDVLTKIGNVISSCPADFHAHPSLTRVLKARQKSIDEGKEIDWATGEALAFGALLEEGNHVRLSGQDVERGTFSHRHHVLHDQKIDQKIYTPLKHISPTQAPYTVSNSHLSEYAVLGFELGYSQARPNSLVIWEAQFGDFANTAQPIIDQFISSGESKWGRMSGIVLLLPHGYEGQGPEHSSARLERFLQMASDDEDVFVNTLDTDRTQIEACNWQVFNVTTPANYFHALRRQCASGVRKPAIFMAPKSLLRHPSARSTLADMGPGTHFQRLIRETNPAIYKEGSTPNTAVTRVIFCAGKIYYELEEARLAAGITDIAIARVEQISPFPMDLVAKHSDDFPNAEIVWCQEEPKNMGAWSFVKPRIETALKESVSHSGKRPSYIGRTPSASTATGDKKVHKKEEYEIMKKAFVAKV